MRNHPQRSRRGLVATMMRYLRGRRGVVSPIMALALIPIIGAMGMAAEASNWWLTQRSLQNAADAAAMAAAVDAGANYVANGNFYSITAQTPTTCTSATDKTTSWYCQAKGASAKYNLVDGSNTVVVTPVGYNPAAAVTTPCPVTTNPVTKVCYQVTITKSVPIFLLSVLGFSGSQSIKAIATAAPPGPPIDFCILTTNGDYTTNGAPGADLLGCDIFANGNATCDGGDDGIGQTYASGTIKNKCPVPSASQPAQCDPYGLTTQTIQKASVSCPLSTNLSGQIPTMPSCTDALASTNRGATVPVSNLITQTRINAGGVIQVCGNAVVSGSNSAVTPCTGTPTSGLSVAGINYTGTSDLQIIIYNGSLDLNGCALSNSSGTTTLEGGVTIIFAPDAQSTTTCSYSCVPIDSTGPKSGVIDISAPTSGTYSGIAIAQSTSFPADKGCPNNGKAPFGIDFCAAGNTPNLAIQGLVYMPNADLQFSGAISKFTGPGALNCIGLIVQQVQVNGTGQLFNNFNNGSLTKECGSAGANLPTVPGTHTFYQSLIG